MAIDVIQFDLIARAGGKGRALSAGYPDLLIRKSTDALPEECWVERPDSAALAEHHGWNGPIYDSRAIFRGLGYELDVIDRAKLEGSERVIDLNEPQELGEYDLVIDPGTIEHCFNVAQAAKNLADAVKVGGIISQAVPMSMFNHGYYNINPVWFVDFYRANGFRLEFQLIRCGDWIMNNVTSQRMTNIPDGAVNVTIARRIEKKPIVWPQQR